MLVAEVGEDGHVVGDLGDPIEGQPVRGGLDDCRLVAGGGHSPKQSLQLGGLGRGDVLRIGRSDGTDLRRRGTDQAHGNPARFENGRGQERSGGLAVRAGDADDPEFAARVAVPPRRGRGQSAAGVFDDDLWQGRAGNRALDDRGRGPESGRSRHVIVAVGMGTLHGHEQRGRRNVPRVEGHAPDEQAARGQLDRPAGTGSRLKLPQSTGRFEAVDKLLEPARGDPVRCRRAVPAIESSAEVTRRSPRPAPWAGRAPCGCRDARRPVDPGGPARCRTPTARPGPGPDPTLRRI